MVNSTIIGASSKSKILVIAITVAVIVVTTERIYLQYVRG